MRFYRKAESAATEILEAFQSGNLPQALAPVFIHRKDNVPCRAWSWSNQLLAAVNGTSDARGYRQWQAVGRQVRKGEKSFAILVPIIKKRTTENPETGEKEEASYIAGFTSAPVFGIEQTEGDPLPPPDAEVTAWLDRLPLLEVAWEWGLSVDAYNGRPGPRWADTAMVKVSPWECGICPPGPMKCAMPPTTGWEIFNTGAATGGARPSPNWAGPSCWKGWATRRKATAAAAGSM